jgi:SIR2-like domain
MKNPSNKIIFLIGNGLGRAFNNDDFATEKILERLRDDPTKMEAKTRDFFQKVCLRGFPTSEEQLGNLELLEEAFNLIDDFSFKAYFCDHFKNNDVLIDDEFRKKFKTYFSNLKSAFLKEVYNSAKKLLEGHEDFKSCMNKFCKFIENNNVTIATLNYDTLIYSFLLKNKFDYFSDNYTDGFKIKKDKETERIKLNKFSSHFLAELLSGEKKRIPYLHLHGSTIFTLDNGDVIKEHWKYLPSDKKNNLVILTSKKRKIQNIYSAPQNLFHCYSRRFFEELSQANQLIIFGYGGNDDYLNKDIGYILSKRHIDKNDLSVKIICKHSKNEKSLKKIWDEALVPDSRLFTNNPDKYKIETKENLHDVFDFT